jgi:hypothetical protein
VIERPYVKAEADWFVKDWGALQASLKMYKVAMVGSGAWACASITLASGNTAAGNKLNLFSEKIQMWTYEEQIDGRNLTDIINETHENPKYLPGTQLGGCACLRVAAAAVLLLLLFLLLLLLPPNDPVWRRTSPRHRVQQH